jgi:phosphomannomutase
MIKHTFDSTILRSYDIRGVYVKTLTDEDALMLGFFFGITVREKNPIKKNPLIVIGMDGRLSSPALEEKLNEGLENSGCEIYRIGLGPTPMLYFASNYYKADGAIQVTGSHNPKNYNGFKIVLNQNSFFGEDIQKLGNFLDCGYQ